MTDTRDRTRDKMLRELARKNLLLGAVQVGQLSKKQLAIDRALWAARDGKPAEDSKETPSTMATWASIA